MVGTMLMPWVLPMEPIYDVTMWTARKIFKAIMKGRVRGGRAPERSMWRRERVELGWCW